MKSTLRRRLLSKFVITGLKKSTTAESAPPAMSIFIIRTVPKRDAPDACSRCLGLIKLVGTARRVDLLLACSLFARAAFQRTDPALLCIRHEPEKFARGCAEIHGCRFFDCLSDIKSTRVEQF